MRSRNLRHPCPRHIFGHQLSSASSFSRAPASLLLAASVMALAIVGSLAAGSPTMDQMEAARAVGPMQNQHLPRGLDTGDNGRRWLQEGGATEESAEEELISTLEEPEEGTSELVIPEDLTDGGEQVDALVKELKNLEEEIEELATVDDDLDEGMVELEEQVIKDFDELEEDIFNLEGSDDTVVEQEQDELMDLEDEMAKKFLGEVFDDNYSGDLVGDDEFMDEFSLEHDQFDPNEDDDDYDYTSSQDYETSEDLKEDIAEIEQEIADAEEDIEEQNDDGSYAKSEIADLERYEELVKEKLEEQQEIDAELKEMEDLRDSAPNAFVDGESKSNSDDEAGFPWVKWEGNADVAKYGVWLALPLVLLLAAAAYRCKSRRGSNSGRSPLDDNDGYAHIQLVGDTTMV